MDLPFGPISALAGLGLAEVWCSALCANSDLNLMILVWCDASFQLIRRRLI